MSRLQLGLGMAPVLQSACAMKRCCWLARQACPPQLLHLALLPAMASCRLPSRSIYSALPSICALLCRMACPPVLPLLLHMLSCLTLACAAARHVPCALPGIACTLPCACPACHGSEAGTAPGVGSPAACCTSHRRMWLPSARIPPPSEARAVPGPGQRQYPARDRWGIRCCPAAVARTPAPSAALTGGRRCRRSPCAAPVCRRSGRRRPGLERSRCWTACGPPLMRPSHSRSVTCTGGGQLEWGRLTGQAACWMDVVPAAAGMGQVNRPQAGWMQCRSCHAHRRSFAFNSRGLSSQLAALVPQLQERHGERPVWREGQRVELQLLLLQQEAQGGRGCLSMFPWVQTLWRCNALGATAVGGCGCTHGGHVSA